MLGLLWILFGTCQFQVAAEDGNDKLRLLFGSTCIVVGTIICLGT